jgi:hypothetical protein
MTRLSMWPSLLLPAAVLPTASAGRTAALKNPLPGAIDRGHEPYKRIIAFLRDQRHRPEAAGHSGDGGRDDSRYIEPVPGGADSDD